MNSKNDENKKDDRSLPGSTITSIFIKIGIGILFFILSFKNFKTGNQTTEEINVSNLAFKDNVPSKLLDKTPQDIDFINANNDCLSLYKRDMTGFTNNWSYPDNAKLNIENFEKAQSNFKISSNKFCEICIKVNSLTIILNDFSNYLIDFCEENDISSEEKIEPKNLSELIIYTDNFIKNYDILIGGCDLLSDSYSAKIKDLFIKILELCISIVSTSKEYLLKKENLILKWKEMIKSRRNSTKWLSRNNLSRFESFLL